MESSVSMQELNAPRFGRTSGGHVESYFLRANDPRAPRALWLKATVLRRASGETLAEVWACRFERDATRPVAAVKVSVPLTQASFGGAPLAVTIDAARFRLDAAAGESDGALRTEQAEVRWKLRWERADEGLGAPLSILPLRSMIDGPFPESKLVTPSPALRFSGHLEWDGERWEMGDWLGMQGHNWGRRHARAYAWGQCLFIDDAGEPSCMVEGFSGRAGVGPLTLPMISALWVRRGGRDYRFNRLVELWRQRAEVHFPRWRLRIAGPDGDAELAMQAPSAAFACLGYENPDGTIAYCLNTKVASVTLRVNPTNEDGFECTSLNGGALEFLQPEPAPGVARLV